MFPHVHAQQRLVARGERRAGSTHVDDIHRTIGLLHQPGPAGTEVAHGGGHERLLELVVAAPLLVDGIGQRPGRGCTAFRLHAAPEKSVVPHLRGVVVNAAGRFPDDVFQRSVLEFGALDQLVKIGHVGLMMLAVVVLECFPGYVGLQRIQRIGQCG